jgi:DNA-binding response OmpR family regulator
MISSPTVTSQHRPHPAPARKPRLLIVSDCLDRLAELKVALAADGIEITCATPTEGLSQACRRGHSLAVVDVGPAYLPAVLAHLRSNTRYAEIPVLVAASRLSSDPALAGVLPKYRAMPCSQAELLALARRRITSTTARRSGKKVL